MREDLSFARVARVIVASSSLAGISGVMGCHVGMALAVAGSALDQPPYRAETIAAELGPSSVRTIGCLDVGLAIYERDHRELVDVHVGNRCGHPESLDLGKLAIQGVDTAGRPRLITLHDPRNEIIPLHVGAAEKGRERFRMENAHDLTRLCFDLEAIAPDAPAARPAPLCFERHTGWLPARGGLT